MDEAPRRRGLEARLALREVAGDGRQRRAVAHERADEGVGRAVRRVEVAAGLEALDAVEEAEVRERQRAAGEEGHAADRRLLPEPALEGLAPPRVLRRHAVPRRRVADAQPEAVAAGADRVAEIPRQPRPVVQLVVHLLDRAARRRRQRQRRGIRRRQTRGQPAVLGRGDGLGDAHAGAAARVLDDGRLVEGERRRVAEGRALVGQQARGELEAHVLEGDVLAREDEPQALAAVRGVEVDDAPAVPRLQGQQGLQRFGLRGRLADPEEAHDAREEPAELVAHGQVRGREDLDGRGEH